MEETGEESRELEGFELRKFLYWNNKAQRGAGLSPRPPSKYMQCPTLDGTSRLLPPHLGWPGFLTLMRSQGCIASCFMPRAGPSFSMDQEKDEVERAPNEVEGRQ